MELVSGIARISPDHLYGALTDAVRAELRALDGLVPAEPEPIPEVRQTREQAMPQSFGRRCAA